MSNYKPIPLSELPPKSWGTVHSILITGDSRRRLMDLGLVPGTKVQTVRKSPFGDPTAYLIRGAIIGLRKEDSQKILVIREV